MCFPPQWFKVKGQAQFSPTPVRRKEEKKERIKGKKARILTWFKSIRMHPKVMLFGDIQFISFLSVHYQVAQLEL